MTPSSPEAGWSASCEPELVLDTACELAEGPAWDERSGSLVFVDIHGGAVHTYEPSTGARRGVSLGGHVSAVVPRRSDGWLVAVGDGLAVVDLETASLDVVHDVEADVPDTRLNDGKCDPAGRFWVGTMAFSEDERLGSLYCLDPVSGLREVLSEVTVSNGLGWSPDGATMYYIDSPTLRVDAFDYDLDAGQVTRRRPLVSFPDGVGFPDGLAVDSHGFLWVAMWGGGTVRRFDPSGRAAGVIHLPVSLVTSCAFGGDDLRDLYITTARRGLTNDELAQQSGAGGVFRVEVDVPGQRTVSYGG